MRNGLPAEAGSTFALTVLGGLLIMASATHAEERKGFFWGADLGGGYVERTVTSTNGVDDAAARLYMNFFGGYAFNPRIAIGLEGGGWLIEPDSDTYIWNPYWPPDNQASEEPSGEGIMKIFAFTQIYPDPAGNLFIKLGGGYIDHWTKSSMGITRNEGWGAEAALGYNIPVHENWSLTPMVSYSYGEADVQTHKAITASLGLIWHQWKRTGSAGPPL
jgi:hypothetical protein